MNIVCIGGGPAGLYFSLLMKKQNPEHRITVIERNRPYDTFGWGVVFSDQTLGNLANADEPTARAILQAFNHWDDIEIHFKGQTVRSGGHGFCGIGRKRLLNILQARCEELGVQLVFETQVQDDQAIAKQYGADLVIASDGLNSRIRTRYAASYQPEVDQRHCRFVWLGTRKKFEAFTFAFRQTEFGWFQAHIYQYDGDTSTFIVETPEHVWRAAGLDAMSQDEGIAFCEALFAEELDGHGLLSNSPHLRGSAQWITFPRIVCRQWVHRQDGVPVVLMGDAAHTAHYSIGSGTKLALEDAIELARCFGQHADADAGTDAALAAYQQLRAIEVLKIQSAARNSMEWFENVERYSAMEAPQFAYSMLTRSQRISHENLRLRDPAYVAGYESWLARRAGEQADVAMPEQPVPPMLTPFRLRGVLLKNRIAVSPMAQYSAVDGVAGDYHLMHLGARAMGGAGLVFAEMTCVSADARITPACPGMYSEAHTQAWRRIVDFVHGNSDAKIALQLGHAGAKGSTRPMWDGIDQPLGEGNWPLISASEQQYLAGVSQVARAATESDLARIEQDFVRATLAAAVAGFDWLELHCAHGYLLSSFISPLTNRRTDEYGGSLENRCRYPLRVFRAMRAAWPQDKPMSVRISAHDWVEGGITPDDAVVIARLFKQAGADLIDCSSGQVSKREQPVYGRMFQAPFADRVRNEAGIASMAVGSIFEADHANSIIAAGRADLCAVGRPHLANPAWTLTEMARIGYSGAGAAWPKQYRPGQQQLERNLQRERQLAAANTGLTPQQVAARLLEG
ncbi:bifunctional salicylyl-CoA 5-hydroxylase/oxidoreductase [Janthinobacterium sp. GW460P]|uniref:bifunctional salicylyl-CoA 5-hydroxylase/oxidoreductase n=1 Tax=unclassified Janthinobacterium TaxID=2610881 RepID=UPI000A32033C|nr:MULTISPECIES: bifunctional salicylyl-CoA 5-hydroxylase/oxidoreductase [unclassified Janthinobacterium]MCC7701321.1 bifunctional salicylyl-CoA 5-hydroxylase/oxidoreductase [Janthinobacterium sp. GW460P]MCC7706828.1 bifunctional salicylyl-CoA 5-hydroxylase/oxidoreductase [Janthinobacterium sp. GW460W]